MNSGDKVLKIVPLGGLQQIGANCTLFTGKNFCFIIDAGILFPNEDFFDINYLIPDYSYIETVTDKVPTDLIITHGHEDHIGAIPHLLIKYPEIKIHCSIFTAALIKRRLKRWDMDRSLKLITENSIIQIGEMIIHPIHMTHSIPETFSFLMLNSTHQYSVLWATDFKIDLTGHNESPPDLNKIKKYSNLYTKRFLFIDSTNILSKNVKTPSESELIPNFKKIFSEKLDNRIFITCFSSNIFRIKNILDICIELKRPLIAHGQSMINYIQTAMDEGLIDEKSIILEINKSELKNLEEMPIVLLSGCQGDFKGALKRVTSGEDSLFKPIAGDVFLFSSRAIPGNEKKINKVMNDLVELGHETVSPDDHMIHVSGHPGKEDIKMLVEAYLPTDLFPIHGESHFLSAAVDYFSSQFPKIKNYIFFNYAQLTVHNDLKVKIEKCFEPPRPIMISQSGKMIPKEVISERRKIAQNGLIIVVIDKDLLRKSPVQISTVGLNITQEQKIEVENKVHKLLHNIHDPGSEKCSLEIKTYVRKFFNNILGHKPQTIIQFF